MTALSDRSVTPITSAQAAADAEVVGVIPAGSVLPIHLGCRGRWDRRPVAEEITRADAGDDVCAACGTDLA